MYGRIESAWRIDKGKLNYMAAVPANTSATLYLLASSINGITESGKVAAETD